jgi:PmbA protein
MTKDLISMATDMVARARKKGADACDVIVSDGLSTEVSINNGTIEQVEQSEGREIGLRVFVGESAAIVSGSVFTSDALEKLAERAVDMAKLAPPDPFAGIADASLLAKDVPELDLYSDKTLSAAQLQKMAEEMEQIALAVPGVSKSSGSGASFSSGWSALATSNGFAKSYGKTSFGLGISVIAGEGTGMERDYDGHSALHLGDLESIEKIGRTAGERAVKRLAPRKIASQDVPIIYDRRVATSLVSHMLGAINGSAIARGTSFLKDKLGAGIFRPGVTIIDDPLRTRGGASRPYDGEGLPVQRRAIIDKGVLTGWTLDLRSARKLELTPTGQGARGTSSPPGPTTSNIYMEAGTDTPEAMMKALGKGFLVTEFIGSTINPVTGDYSRGASGFWFENGEIAYPVSEITVGGNLIAMFKLLTPASDLIFRGSFSVPSLLVEGMTIAGV